jgi:adenylate cyclase
MRYPVKVERVFVCKRTLSEAWALLSDTDRMNRAIGAGAVSFSPAPENDASAARFVGHAKLGALSLEYEEMPFEWVREQKFSVLRTMKAGPIHSYRFGAELTKEAAETTRIRLFVDVELKTRWLNPLVQVLGATFLGSIETYVHSGAIRIPTEIAKPGSLTVTSPATLTASKARRAQRFRELETAGVDAPTSQALEQLLTLGRDDEVARIRPFEWADFQSFDRRRSLAAMLHAVNAGILELRWALICPSCTVPADLVPTLDKIEPPGHCQFCDLNFDLDLDKAVEAVFVPHAGVRTLDPKPFCIGGPGRTPQVLSQKVLGLGEHHTLAAPKEHGRYRLFAKGGATCNIEVTSDGVSDATVYARNEAFEPTVLRLKPEGKIAVHNERGDAFHLKLEALVFATAAATAHFVSTLPEFRRHFSSQLLKTSTPLKVARVTLLFSDLTGSTALYSEVGDAEAFRFVDDHFDILKLRIEANQGTIIKTMGDAIMASFVDEQAAVRASSELLVAFNTLARTKPFGDRVGLKLGLFTGPCYVVTANERLDYFGQTANVAARLQGLAESGELIVQEQAFADLEPETSRLFNVSTCFTQRVKGVAEELKLVRLVLNR